MDELVNPARCCPECRSREYDFMGRKKIPAEAGQPAGIETRIHLQGLRACVEGEGGRGETRNLTGPSERGSSTGGRHGVHCRDIAT
jgi:hypothetical protein